MANFSSSMYLLLNKGDINKSKYKHYKILWDVGIAHRHKAGKQGRDDSIKQFCIQPHPTDLHNKGMYRAELCTELFYAVTTTLFPCFGWSAIPRSCHIFDVFFYFCCTVEYISPWVMHITWALERVWAHTLQHLHWFLILNSKRAGL